MKVYEYTVIFEPEEEGRYLAHIPALNGLTTEGDTMEEINEMAKDAIKCFLETCIKKGLPIPDDTLNGEPIMQKLSIAV
jgi:predicted RNase H-like HicB family nuclease